jgi:hypothetical protein
MLNSILKLSLLKTVSYFRLGRVKLVGGINVGIGKPLYLSEVNKKRFFATLMDRVH